MNVDSGYMNHKYWTSHGGWRLKFTDEFTTGLLNGYMTLQSISFNAPSIPTKLPQAGS